MNVGTKVFRDYPSGCMTALAPSPPAVNCRAIFAAAHLRVLQSFLYKMAITALRILLIVANVKFFLLTVRPLARPKMNLRIDPP